MDFSGSFLFCLLAPPLAILAGGLLVRVWRPSPALRSSIQHFTAGLVLGAVAIELCPELITTSHFYEVVVGFAIGAAFMLAVAQYTRRAETAAGTSTSLIFAVAIDLFVDGLLMGTSLSVGKKQGVLVAIALTFCAFFLTLATSATLHARNEKRGKVLLVILALAVLVVAGVLLAGYFASLIAGGLLSGTIAFATAALLYLVVEELLPEAHEEAPDRTLTPALFFCGFLLVYLLQRLLG
jgi:ZIP family zinc transporter